MYFFIFLQMIATFERSLILMSLLVAFLGQLGLCAEAEAEGENAAPGLMLISAPAMILAAVVGKILMN